MSTSNEITVQEALALIQEHGLRLIEEDGPLVWFVLDDTTDEYVHAVVLTTDVTNDEGGLAWEELRDREKQP